MKLFEKIALWWHNITKKRKVAIVEPDSGDERWYALLSPIAMVMSGIALVFIVFAILLAMVAYTPVLDMLPGYRTDASRSRQTLIRTLIRVDSLERKMNQMLVYNENRILVVDGKMPTSSSVRKDTVVSNKNIVPPSATDTLFRRQMESEREQLLNNGNNTQQRTSINAVKPMDGIISERFNAKVGLFGIRMAGSAESQIIATAEGTVIAVDWLPESGNSIAIQHNDGIISIYRNLSGAIVTKGQRVTKGEVIGYSAVEEQADKMFEFEMWMGGKPLNPESYILF